MTSSLVFGSNQRISHPIQSVPDVYPFPLLVRSQRKVFDRRAEWMTAYVPL